MDQGKILQTTREFVKTTLAGAEGGHDWFHIQRVVKNAKEIAKSETVDPFVIELGALLHDIADSKFHQGDETVGPRVARNFLMEQQVKTDIIEHLVKIIENISFKGGNVDQKFSSPELSVIQDADRLDAMGAIGIARTFNFGGHKGRPIYDPAILPRFNMTKEEYKNSSAPTLNHFYEKLLLLKDKMNTASGRRMAEKRHAFMEAFLNEFFLECGMDPFPLDQNNFI